MAVVRLSVFVNKITLKIMTRFQLNFQETVITGQGTDDHMLVMFWITIWIQELFEGCHIGVMSFPVSPVNSEHVVSSEG